MYSTRYFSTVPAGAVQVARKDRWVTSEVTKLVGGSRSSWVRAYGMWVWPLTPRPHIARLLIDWSSVASGVLNQLNRPHYPLENPHFKTVNGSFKFHSKRKIFNPKVSITVLLFNNATYTTQSVRLLDLFPQWLANLCIFFCCLLCEPNHEAISEPQPLHYCCLWSSEICSASLK